MKFITAIKILLLVLAIILVGAAFIEQVDEPRTIAIDRQQTILDMDPSVIADLENQISREIAVKQSREPAQVVSEQDDATTTDDGVTTNEPEEIGDTSEDEPAQEPVDTIPSYVTVSDSCGPDYGGNCLRVRSAPSTSASVQTRVRNGQTLKVGDYLYADGRWWYEIVFDEWLRYPDRLEGEWYIAAEYVQPVENAALAKPTVPEDGEKRIIVNLTEQKLYAYEGDELFMEESVSTGKLGAATPRGTFTVFYRTPSRYMQGPLPGITDDDYDLPGVPWNLYFTQQGAVIHGAYWHDKFGQHWSNGCVNLPTEKAKQLYAWTPEGTTVVVRD